MLLMDEFTLVAFLKPHMYKECIVQIRTLHLSIIEINSSNNIQAVGQWWWPFSLAKFLNNKHNKLF